VAKLNQRVIKVEKVETYLGTTYRFYVHGVYMGAAPTRARAIDAAKKALETWDFKTMKRKRRPKP
jgi:hypothetical protein